MQEDHLKLLRTDAEARSIHDAEVDAAGSAPGVPPGQQGFPLQVLGNWQAWHFLVAGFSPGPWIASAMFHRQTAARRSRVAWLLKPKLHMFKHMLKRCLRWRLLAAVHVTVT